MRVLNLPAGKLRMAPILGVAFVYYLSALVSLQFALVGSVVTPIWPPTGIALVALFRYGPRVWPGIALAALAVNLPLVGAPGAVVAIAVGNTLTPVLAWAALSRLKFRPSLDRLQDSLYLVIVGLVSTTLSAAIGSWALRYSGLIDRDHILETAAVWWAGDASGILIFAPVLLLFRKPRPRFKNLAIRKLETVGLVVGLAAAAPFAFLESTIPSRYLIFPFVVWAAVRFGQSGAVLTTLAVTAGAIWAAVNGVGPFAGGTLLARMLSLQIFNVSVATTAFILSSATDERRRVLRLVEQSAQELEDAVAERSTELIAANERLIEQIKERDLAQKVMMENEGLYLQEHEIAETLQRTLLPARLPDLPGLSLAARYLPGSAGIDVGGDWYDVFPMPTGRVGLVVGDVIGRGLKAAAAMGQLRIALRAYAMDADDPAEVLSRLSGLLEDLRDVEMATAFFGIVDYGNHSFRYASAGHPAPLLLQPNGTAEFLEGGRRPPLGVQMKGEPSAAADLEPGATLLLYTDGLVETRLQAIDVGMDRLKELVEYSDFDLEHLCDRVISNLVEVATDDVALLALRTSTSLEEDLTLTVPANPKALPAARRALGQWFSRAGATEQEAGDLILAGNEAIANAIEHAYEFRSGSVRVEATLTGPKVEIAVSDQGQWRDPVAGDRGRGLMLMSAVLDHVEVQRSAEGTTVRMVRTLGDGWKESGEPVRFMDVVLEGREHSNDDNIPVATVRDDIDLSSVARIGQELQALVSRRALGLVVDLSPVRFIDSAGVRTLFRLAERVAHEGQVLAVVTPEGSAVNKILQLVQFSAVAPVLDSVEAAKAAIQGAG